MIKPLFLLKISLFFLILWPTYIALKIGPLPALSPDRLMQVILIIVFTVFFIFKKKIINRFNNYHNIVILLFYYCLWSFTTCFVGSDAIANSMFSFFNWIIVGPFIFFYSLLFITKESELNKFIYLIILIMLFVNIIGMLEVYKGESLFKGLLLTENQFTLGALSDKARDGIYRIRSVFYNPLIYAQFLLASIPLQIYMYNTKKSTVKKTFLIINILMTIFLVYKTGSRAGLVIIFTIPILIIYITMYKRKWFKYISYILIFSFLSFISIGIYTYVEEHSGLINNLHSANVHGEIDAETLSTIGRILQFKFGMISILEHPIFGIGLGQAVKAVEPMSSIDNYYLTLILSTGSVGLIFFLTFIYFVILQAIESIKKYKDLMTIYLLISFIIIFGYYLILSIPKANSLLFFFASLIYIRSNMLKGTNVA